MGASLSRVERSWGADGNATCPKANVARVGSVLSIVSCLWLLFIHHYAGAVLVLVFLVGPAIGALRKPWIDGAQPIFAGHVVVGNWVVVGDLVYAAQVATVLAKYEDHAPKPGPVIRLALANGKALHKLEQEAVHVARLVDSRSAKRATKEPDWWPPDGLLEVMRLAFEAQRADSDADWIDVQLIADKYGVGVDELDPILQAAWRLNLLRLNVRSQRSRVKCTEAGVVWTLAAHREVGTELEKDAARPESLGGPVIYAYGSVVNTGTMIGHIEAHLNQLDAEQSDIATVKKALKLLTEAAAEDPKLTPEQRTEVLEAVDHLAVAAAQPEAQRHRGAIRGTLQVLASTLGVSADLATVWEAAGPAISNFFGIS